MEIRFARGWAKNLQPDSIGHRLHDTASGRGISRAWRRDQSSPSTSAATCEAESRITPSLMGGQRNPFRSRRFQKSTSPDPSHAKIFKRSARFERKMMITPENGSSWSCSLTRAARLSAPRRKSTGFVATSTRTPAGTAIMSLPSRRATRSSASRRQSPARPAPWPPQSRSRLSRRCRRGSAYSSSVLPAPPVPVQMLQQRSHRPHRRRPAAPGGANKTTVGALSHAAVPQPKPVRRPHSSQPRSVPSAPRSTGGGVQTR